MSEFVYRSGRLPEGNYLVELELGTESRPSSTTVWSQGRRLMLEEVAVPAGQAARRTIAVELRSPALAPVPPNAPGGSAVALHEEEAGAPDWASELRLAFRGSAPAARVAQLRPAPELPTIFLAGDSTVCDQGEPYASWGQVLPLYVGPGALVGNHAESGETLKSFISSHRLAKLLERIKAGDYLIIQFCHNDQKSEWPQTYAAVGSTYEAYLRAYIEEARLRGATPILATAPQRRRFDGSGRQENTHGPYPDAVRALAAEEGLLLIDLELASRRLYEALGPEASRAAFAVAGDETHHGLYGARELAKCVARDLAASGLPIAAQIAPGLESFDPAHPDPPPMRDAAPDEAAAERPRGY